MMIGISVIIVTITYLKSIFSKQNPIPEPVIIEHPVSENYYVGVDRAVMIEKLCLYAF